MLCEDWCCGIVTRVCVVWVLHCGRCLWCEQAMTFTASVDFRLQLTGDNSPGQISFWYTITPAINSSDSGSSALTMVPQTPSPNNAAVLLVLTTDRKEVPYTLRLWTRDQGGSLSVTPTPVSWTVAAQGRWGSSLFVVCEQFVSC